MKWENWYKDFKSALNSKFGTSLEEDTTPAEALDAINKMEAGETSNQNAEQIGELTGRMTKLESGLQLLSKSMDDINSKLEASENDNSFETKMEDVNNSITDLKKEVNSLKMSYSKPGSVEQKTTKPGTADPKPENKNKRTVQVSLSEILTGNIKN